MKKVFPPSECCAEIKIGLERKRERKNVSSEYLVLSKRPFLSENVEKKINIGFVLVLHNEV